MVGKERQKDTGGGGFLSCRHMGSRKRKTQVGWAGTLEGFPFYAILQLKIDYVKWLS